MKKDEAVALAKKAMSEVRDQAWATYQIAGNRVQALLDYDTAIAPLWEEYMQALGQVEKAHPELRHKPNA